MANDDTNGPISTSEAGHRGGEETSRTHGRDFYSKIGKKGGAKVHQLVEEAKRHESGQ